ncbi:MAG: hypothetical protein HQM00_12335, partial [Magnetococcales bacterium]|nr:hypothetical protein [Magnetococcales bacterium]
MDQKNDPSIWRIQQPIIASFLLAFGVLIGMFLFSLYWMHTEQEPILSDNFPQQVQEILQLLASESQRAMHGHLTAIRHNRHLAERFQERDREGLQNAIQPLFSSWQKEQGITRLYFHDPDGVNFLRAHRPEVHGDPIQRSILNQARKSGQITQGLEIGRFGTLTFRVVSPWVQEGRLLGYLEMGTEITTLMQRIHKALNVNIHLLIDKKFIAAATWEAHSDPQHPDREWNRFND